ncbi:MAG: PQQ-binding-like beta-propeller repeat protein [Lachnospiraceae bacterium]|nr:PQQ-binding-like beta-propeller repeat protein [Lachnospiraceae bacterium]
MKIRYQKLIAAITAASVLGLTVSTATGVSQANCFVTEEKTPVNTERGGTIWSRSFSDGRGTTYNSQPIVTEDTIYIVSKNILYALDSAGNIIRQKTLSASMNSVCFMELYEGKLFIPLSGGCMECVDAETFEHVWLSESFGGQSLSYVTCHEGFVYAGTTEMKMGNTTEGTFYCLDTRDGSVQWSYHNFENTGGYYWSGSCVMNDRLYFAGDNGRLVEHDLTQDVIYSETVLSGEGQIRSNLVYEEDQQALYTVSNVGEFIAYAGEKVSSWKLFPQAKAVNCTSTPTIVDGTAYVGAMADGMGYLCVWDIAAHSMRYTVETGKGCEVKSTPLVSTAYGDAKYIYYSHNNIPGGVYYIIDSKGSVSSVQYTLYEPAVAKQYCISSIVPGAGGVLYYSNDTGTLFAVSEVERSSDYVEPTPPSAGSAVQDKTPSPGTSSGGGKENSATSKKVKKPKKPSKVRIKKTKKGFKIRWKKGSGSAKTFVYGKVGKGKWKKLTSTKKTSYIWKNPKKKKTYIRLRSGIKFKNKWYYSEYTKKYKIKS